MAQMYPSHLDQSVARSEQDVYKSLQYGLNDNWHVIHSRRFVIPATQGQRAREGELDFLIVHPRKAIIALEVKGGREIGKDEHGWYSIPHDRDEKNRIKDPGRQVQDSIRSLLAYVEGQARIPELARLPFCWGVAFPGMEIDRGKEFGPELPTELILDRTNLRSPENMFLRMYEYWGMQEYEPFSEDVCDELINLIMPRFSLIRSPKPRPQPVGRLRAAIRTDEQRILRLTDEQMRIVDAMSEVSRLGVMGPAGTGKTIVAMEQARRLTSKGKKVLFLCYNKALAQHLEGSADGFEVRHFHRFCREVVLNEGIPFTVPRRDPAAFWEVTAAESLYFALEENTEARWDAVIVDEGQDFKDLWWLSIQKLLVSEDKGTFWVFYDPNQNIYAGDSIGTLELTPYRLLLNCRNTKRIAERAYGFLGLEPDFLRNAPEGIETQEIVCADNHEMIEGVRKSLHRLINEEEIPAERIIILSPKSVKSSLVWRQRRFGNFELVEYGEALESSQVSFSSIQKFKGLEEQVVIMCELDKRSKRCSPKHLYVGASRAKHALVSLTYSTA